MNQVEEISPDERCYGLAETNRQVNGEWRRVQVVYVARNGELCEHVTDLGNAFLWEKVLLQAIYADGDETVGVVTEEADRGRHDDYALKLREEIRESSTLIKDFIQEKEENIERIANRSVFGPKHKKARNEFPHSLRRR